MAKLLLNNGSGPAQEFFLPTGLSRVGRNSANEIVIDHPSVSSFHCEITAGSDSVSIKDLGSTNGTFLEGTPVQEATLTHGQRLRLGAIHVMLEAPEATQSPSMVDGAPALVPSVPTLSKPRLSVRMEHSPAATIDTAAAVAVAHSAPATPKLSPQMDRDRVEGEARSKMLWGDPLDEVTKYLRMQGLSIEEAMSLSNVLLQERVKILRGIGVQKILTGIGLVCVPIISFFAFLHMGVFPIKLFGMTVAVGLYGAWRWLKGMFMFLAPKSEPGDVADK